MWYDKLNQLLVLTHYGNIMVNLSICCRHYRYLYNWKLNSVCKGVFFYNNCKYFFFVPSLFGLFPNIDSQYFILKMLLSFKNVLGNIILNVKQLFTQYLFFPSWFCVYKWVKIIIYKNAREVSSRNTFYYKIKQTFSVRKLNILDICLPPRVFMHQFS